MMYVLIVILSAMNGNQTITIQQFSSKPTCEAALELIKTNSRRYAVQWAGCTEQ